jgi:hypothetical protein
MIIDYKLCKEKTTVDKIDKLIESSPVSSYVDFYQMQRRIQHKRFLNLPDLERRLRSVFKTISPDIFVDRKDRFKKLKKKILTKRQMNETKLKSFLTGQTMLEENCAFIREMLNG